MKKNWNNLNSRTRVREYEEVEEIIQKTLYGTIKKKKVRYKYYICDNCAQRVIVTDYKDYKSNGSIIQYMKPDGFKVPIVVHNGTCSKEAIESINKYFLL